MSKQALVCSGGGIGDVIQTTPLIQAVGSLGYAVDVWLVPDDPDTASLLDKWSAIRRLIMESQEISFEHYDEIIVALCFPHGHFFYRSRFSTGRRRELGKRNVAEFEMRHATRLGFAGPTPLTYARKSSRRFLLLPRTVGIHPGSRTSEWYALKRWPHFPRLARLLLDAGFNVAIVGTTLDGAPGDKWPEGILDFRGSLGLLDTGALLSQCDAVVSNDSGIAHLAAALGVLTLIVFGPTSERRHAPPRQNAVPLVARVPCRPCHNPIGCQSLDCLVGLHPSRVLAMLSKLLDE